MRVLVFEPCHRGHFMVCASLVVDAFSSRGHDVVFCSTAEAFRSPEYESRFGPLEGKFDRVSLDGITIEGSLRCKESISKALIVAVMEGRYDVVFVPYLDSFIYASWHLLVAAQHLRSMGTRFSGILMHCDFAHGDCRRPWPVRFAKDVACRVLLRYGPFQRVYLIDEIAFEYLRRRVPTGRISLCPDPVDYAPGSDGGRARGQLSINTNARVVGMFGVLGEEKGVDRVVEAFLRRPRTGQDVLLLMGKLRPTLRAKLSAWGVKEGSRPDLIVIDRFVSDSELAVGLSASDVVAVPYIGHMGSTSFLIRAIGSGRPVLGCNAGWIGHVTRKYGLGRTCDPCDDESLSAGLAWCFGMPSLNRSKATAFLRQHDISVFRDRILECVS